MLNQDGILVFVNVVIARLCVYKVHFCPCILYGKMKRNVDGQPCCGNCLKYMFCATCVHTGTRRKVRTKYNLPARPCNDCCVTFFCGQCALCQEYQEGFTEHRCAIPPETKNDNLKKYLFI
jgi:Cys-rich protein (TIGR01571 family)